MALTIGQTYEVSDAVPRGNRIIAPTAPYMRVGALRLPPAQRTALYSGLDPYYGYNPAAFRICVYVRTPSADAAELIRDAELFNLPSDPWIAAFAGSRLAGVAKMVAFESYQSASLRVGGRVRAGTSFPEIRRAASPPAPPPRGVMSWRLRLQTGSWYVGGDAEQTAFFGIVVNASPAGGGNLRLRPVLPYIIDDITSPDLGYARPDSAGRTRGAKLAAFQYWNTLSLAVRAGWNDMGTSEPHPADAAAAFPYWRRELLNAAGPQADIVDLQADNLSGDPAITSLYVITNPNGRDTDGVRQVDLVPLIGATRTNQQYPAVSVDRGKIEIEGVDYSPRIAPDLLSVVRTGTITTVRADATPAEVSVDGIMRGLDPERVARRGNLYMEGQTWVVSRCTAMSNKGDYAVSMYRRL